MNKSIAYSYLRFSSKRQIKGDSLRRQSELAEKYCEENGLELSTANFQDLGVSAWTGANTEGDSGLSQFFKAVQEGVIPKGSYLLVESLDRLSRQHTQFALTQLLEIVNSGIILVTLMDNQVYKTPVDTTQLIVSITVMTRAHEESETKSKRLRAVWEARRKDPHNSRKAGKYPHWLKLNKDRTTFSVIESQADIVRRAYQLAIEGYGILRIAKMLNNEGHRTITGKLFQEGSIHSYFKNKIVLGVYSPVIRENGKRVGYREEVEGYYPAIIDEETYLLAQSRLKERKKTSSSGRQGTNKNVFIGLATCSKCGDSMVLTNKEVSWITCKSRLVKECDNKPVRLDVMQQWLKEQLIQPMFYQAWASPERQDKSDEIARLEVKLSEEEKALEGLLKATNDFSNAIVLQEVQRRSQLITERSRAIESLKLQEVSVKSARTTLEGTRSLIELSISPDNAEKNLTSRLSLRRLLANAFSSFKVLHQGDVVNIDLEMMNDGVSASFSTMEGSTKSLKKIKEGVVTGSLWSVTNIKHLHGSDA